MIRSETEAVDRKQRIRDRYKGVDTSELEVIPAKAVEGLGESTSIRRVAAYVRVSTDNDEQTSSYELQKNYYTEYIKAQPGWEFVGIYDDEGISGTSLEHRKGMQQLIEDCKAGKIDLVLTKSIARFARNIVDCLSVIETLKDLDPPVGVKFEADIPNGVNRPQMSVKVLKTNDTWYGMTYHEDAAAVKNSFKKMLADGVYKADLFSDL